MPSVHGLRAALSAALLAALVAACGQAAEPADSGADVHRRDVSAMDAVVEDTPPPDAPPEEGSCRADSECDNGLYCDGDERCLGGRCQPGTPPCDDGRSCTHDTCDEMARACTHMVDDSMCGDMNACNGIERCDPAAPGSVPATGCTPVRTDNVIDCDDSNNCTVDSCDPRAGCVHAPRDLDGDGHVDRMCTVDGTLTGMQGDDCNDGDSTVYPGAPEVCADNRDNNCDGRVDFADSMVCRPTNDACGTATRLPGPGTYWGSTVGLTNDYALGCNTGTYADAVFEFTLTAPQDVSISISATGTTAAVSLVSNCEPLTEVRCNRGTFSAAPAIRVRSLMPGTYRIVAETGSTASAFRLSLRYDPPTPQPPEEACPAMSTTPAVELNDGMPHVARLTTLEDDHLLSCNSTPRRDAVFRLTLAADSDVVLRATPMGTGFSTTYVSFRNSPCAVSTSERRCLSGSGVSGAALVQRGLGPGTYWVVVENSSDLDVTVQATVTPAMPRPPFETCPGQTVPTDNTPYTVNWGTAGTSGAVDTQPDVGTSCGSNGTSTSYRDVVLAYTLTDTRDVEITIDNARTGLYTDVRTACTNRTSTVLPCQFLSSALTAPTVRRIRAQPAGTYYIVLETSTTTPLGPTVVRVNATTPVPAVTYTTTTFPPGVSFIDICAMMGSSSVLPTRDDASQLIGDTTTMPFPLRFYGINVTPPIAVATNGWMSLSRTTSAALSGTIPDASDPNMLIAPYWTDLYTRSRGICWGVTGTAPNRKLVIQWDDVHFCCTDDPSVHLTFEVVINEAPAGTSNTIDVIYQRMDGARTPSAAGLENDDATLSTAISGPFTAPRILRFTPSM